MTEKKSFQHNHTCTRARTIISSGAVRAFRKSTRRYARTITRTRTHIARASLAWVASAIMRAQVYLTSILVQVCQVGCDLYCTATHEYYYGLFIESSDVYYYKATNLCMKLKQVKHRPHKFVPRKFLVCHAYVTMHKLILEHRNKKFKRPISKFA